MTEPQTTTLYEAIGGDATVRALTQRFYELMDSLPEAARCRAVHPPDLTGSEEKFYEYLTGWLGDRRSMCRNAAIPCCAAGTSLPGSGLPSATNGFSASPAHSKKPSPTRS